MTKPDIDFDAMLDVLDRVSMMGSAEAMRQHERKRGFTVILPGDRDWFPAAEWSQDCVVSLNGDHVRLCLVVAVKPGTGAFSRLITAIIRADLVPVVLDPFEHMEHILTWWGWTGRRHGSTFDDREERWRPSRVWMLDRARRQP